ncbi:MAG TPA: type II toxin-antitoxin system death-on-curing family toxin [Candidatus Acidoferrum sp.]|nr:type II toxin-antitoxin system death-on-curing family toxin [Candidatus Acidoferrum sp.]
MRKPLWIDERDALAIHDRLLALDAGAAGVRDEGLLQSALARPQQLHAYGKRHDTVDLATANTAGIVRNHPFLDGNKRTGFVIGVLFLEMNGYRLTASEEDATQAVLGLAAGTLDETDFAAWMRANVKRQRGPKIGSQ